MPKNEPPVTPGRPPSSVGAVFKRLNAIPSWLADDRPKKAEKTAAKCQKQTEMRAKMQPGINLK